MHHQGLSYIPEIIRTELTSEKTREFVVRKYYGDLQLLPIPTHCRKDTSYDLILAIVDRLIKMIHYKPVQITIDALMLVAIYTPSSSTAVTAHTSSTRTLSRNLMTAYRKNLQRWLVI